MREAVRNAEADGVRRMGMWQHWPWGLCALAMLIAWLLSPRVEASPIGLVGAGVVLMVLSKVGLLIIYFTIKYAPLPDWMKKAILWLMVPLCAVAAAALMLVCLDVLPKLAADFR